MISDAVLARAVAEGLVSSGQALALQSLARQEEPSPRVPEPTDDERLRFVSGFSDIFVTIGLVLFLGSAAYLADRGGAGAPAVAALVAALSWGLSEFFSRIRRQALPSIVLLVVFTAASFVALAGWFGANGRGPLPYPGWLGPWIGVGWGGAAGAASAAAAAGLAALHYWRFRVPIAVAAIAALGANAALLALYAAAPALTLRFLNPLLLGVGLLAFAVAMRFDLADPRRLTRRADIAFWLHLLAAPLIVRSVFHALGVARGQADPLGAVLILAVFCLLAVVALLIDRRALLVSGLTYAGIAFSALIRQVGAEVGTVAPVTLLILGALVLLLSAGWHPMRTRLLSLLSPGFAARLPRPGLPA